MPGPVPKETRKLIEDLRKEYPDVFTPGCGILINKGWLPLLEAVASQLQKHIDSYKSRYPNGPTSWPRISQVKEKFGSLRIYRERGYINLQIDDVINTVTFLSDRTCEYCGCPGEKTQVFVDKIPLTKVLCEDCHVTFEEDYGRR